jgi:epoxyqueuosine reductase QueG
MDDVRSQLVEVMMCNGAFDVRVADPRNRFELAPEGRHPLTLMPECRSVVVFVVPRPPMIHFWNVGWLQSQPREGGWLQDTLLDQSSAATYCVYAAALLLLNHVSLFAISFLTSLGHRALDGQITGSWMTEMAPAKLCAYEAGIGVYGRSGLILHPTLGNRIVIGVILTDAELEADGRLEGYNPCRGCSICVDGCPEDAYGPDKTYHGHWSQERCLRSRKSGIACANCWELCPSCRIDEERLVVMASRNKPFIERLRDAVSAVADALPYFEEVFPQQAE